MKRVLFVAWQDRNSRRWFPIGRLKSEDKEFAFEYTCGALEAQKQAGFSPLAAFPHLRSTYRSRELFPVFSNRVLRSSRPDYKLFLEWLSLSEANPHPFAVLARSGGQRVTDTLELFPCPERLPDGSYVTHFLVHGLSHMPESSSARVLMLEPGDPLLLMWDCQNPHDPDALALRTAEQRQQDIHVVGYCPRYLRSDILALVRADDRTTQVSVERVNPAPAPIQFRLLCKLRMEWAEGFQPYSGPEYQPIGEPLNVDTASPYAASSAP